MKKNSRTKNSIINSIYASSSQIITIILSFIVRTVFIRTLSAEYLGVNGLFSNIITMLSLADLGIGISIPYTLYKPLAENDENKITSLMALFKKIYNVIGIVVLVVGISLIPFLRYIIKETTDIANLNLIYMMFIINSAASYFFIYKKLLLDSDQKGYIASRVIMKVTILKSITEIIILYVTKNYILYLSTSIIATILQNIIISIKCNKEYPYIKNKSKEKVAKEEIDSLKKNTSALVIYRVGIVAVNGTDNIIISTLINVGMVGIYSNYLLIVDSISKIITQIFDAITASIGNMVVTSDRDKSKDIYFKLQFLNFWLYAICGICVMGLINPFIKIWAGDSYVLNNIIAFCIGLNLYIYGMQGVVSAYRNAYGLFVQGKYRPIIMVIVNIVVSIILAKAIGILGVIIGTIVSRLFVTGIYDPIIVFKYGLKSNVKEHFIQYIKYMSLFIIIGIIFLVIINSIAISNILVWIIVSILSFAILNLILFIVYRKSENVKFYKEKANNFISKLRRKEEE